MSAIGPALAGVPATSAGKPHQAWPAVRAQRLGAADPPVRSAAHTRGAVHGAFGSVRLGHSAQSEGDSIPDLGIGCAGAPGLLFLRLQPAKVDGLDYLECGWVLETPRRLSSCSLF